MASYNRGMKTLHEAGGVKTTVMDDAMQRAPAFVFESAREARAFGEWLSENFDDDQGRRRDHDAHRQAARHRAVLGQPDPLHALQLHDRRRRGAEPHRQGHRGRVRVDHVELRGHRAGSILESNFATDKKSSQVNMLRTRGKRVVAEATVPAELIPKHMHSTGEAALRRPPGLEPRRLHVGREQQRRALRQRHHRALHRDRSGRGQRGRVVRRVRLLRAAAERRLLLLGHDPVADRRHLRRRHRAGHPARVPRDARLLRRRQGTQARRDRRGHRPMRRAVAGVGDRGGGVGQGARPAGAQPPLGGGYPAALSCIAPAPWPAWFAQA